MQDDGDAAAVAGDDFGINLFLAAKDGLADAGDGNVVAGLKVKGGIRVDGERDDTPVDAVAAVTLGGVLVADVGVAAKHLLAGCCLLTGAAVTIDPDTPFDYNPGDYVSVPGIRKAILGGEEQIDAKVITRDGRCVPVVLHFAPLNETERQILADGCLMNYYKNNK